MLANENIISLVGKEVKQQKRYSAGYIRRRGACVFKNGCPLNGSKSLLNLKEQKKCDSRACRNNGQTDSFFAASCRTSNCIIGNVFLGSKSCRVTAFDSCKVVVDGHEHRRAFCLKHWHFSLSLRKRIPLFEMTILMPIVEWVLTSLNGWARYLSLQSRHKLSV